MPAECVSHGQANPVTWRGPIIEWAFLKLAYPATWDVRRGQVVVYVLEQRQESWRAMRLYLVSAPQRRRRRPETLGWSHGTLVQETHAGTGSSGYRNEVLCGTSVSDMVTRGAARRGTNLPRGESPIAESSVVSSRIDARSCTLARRDQEPHRPLRAADGMSYIHLLTGH